MIDQQYPRSQSIIELLVASVRLYRSNVLPFVLITALVVVPYNLLIFVLADAITPLTRSELISSLLLGTSRPAGVSGWPGLIYVLIAQPIMHGALILTAAQSYRQQPVSIGNNVQAARGRLGSLLGVAIQKGLFLFMALILALLLRLLVNVLLLQFLPDNWYLQFASFRLTIRLVFGGVSLLLPLYIYARLILATQAVLLEGLVASDGIARSRALTKASDWHVTAFVVVVLLLQYGLPALIIGATLSGVAALSLDAQLISALQMVLVTIAQIVAWPFSFIAHTLLFFDLCIHNPEHDPLTPGLRDGKQLAGLNT